jgi:anti-sigma-K factor RskA
MTADPHLDTAAFALHAVPADEVTQVSDHLDSCESCSAELIGFLETAALLGSAAAEAPPASLRQAIMSRIAVTAQLPPLTGSSPARPASPSPVSGPPSSAPEPPVAPGPPAGEITSRPRGRHAADDNTDAEVVRLEWYRRPAALIAAAVAAVVIGAGTIVAVNRTGDDNQAAPTPEQCIAQAADRTQITPATGRGSVSYAPSCGAALVDVTGLPALPSDRTYQLWAIAGEQPRSLGVLPEASAGQQQIVAAQTQAGENVVAITEEPAGGSPQPTLPILWQATLAS